MFENFKKQSDTYIFGTWAHRLRRLYSFGKPDAQTWGAIGCQDEMARVDL